MKKTNLILILSMIFFFSCKEDDDFGIGEKKITNVIETSKADYENQFGNYCSYGDLFSNPKWSDYIVLRNSSDTLLVAIPIENDRIDEKWYLVIDRVNKDLHMSVFRKPLKVSNDVLSSGTYILSKPNNRQIVTFNRISTRHTWCPDGTTIIDGETGEGHAATLADCPGYDIYAGMLPEVIITPDSDGDPGGSWWYPDLMKPFDPDTISQSGGDGGKNTPDIASFRSTREMLKDQTVKNAIDDLWKQTKELASKTGRKEKGFWLYYNPSTKKYVAGKFKEGPLVLNELGSNGAVPPGGASPLSNGVANECIPVSFVHAHTTLHYFNSDAQRRTGFSGKDSTYGSSYSLPLILVDYVGTRDFDGFNYIYNSTDINAPYQIYTLDMTDYK